MGFFNRIFGTDQENAQNLAELRNFYTALTPYKPAFRNWHGAIYESELVRAAIDARARHISKLKVEILGTAQPNLQTLLKQAPNGFQTWSQFLYRASTILDVTNNCFIVPIHDEKMNVTGYATILPQRCEVVEDEDGVLWLRYKFSNGRVGAIEFKNCCILTKHQYRDEFFGESNRALNDTMKLIDLNNQGIEEAVKNSATYRFIATLSNFAKPEDLAKERKRFTEENLSGEAGNGGMLLFPNQYKDIKQIDVKPYTVDSDQMNQIRTNVFDYFGVNEDVLQNKAYGDSWSAFYEGCVEVFAIQFSEAMTKTIFTNREIAQGSSIMATSNRLQYLSNKDKLDVSSQMADRGIMTRNEIREIWNLPPIEGGDVPTIRGEYYLLDSEGNTTQNVDDVTEEGEE